jgi:hypothetical protein
MRDDCRFAFVLMMLLAATGCGEQSTPPQPPARDQALERKSFILDGVSYEIQLPAPPAYIDLKSTVDAVTIFASSGQMRYVELKIAGDVSADNFDRKMALKNGRTIVYRVNYDIGGGMRGTEGELVGRIDIDGRALSVTCRDQKEATRPEPEWCLPYVGSLAVIATPQ